MRTPILLAGLALAAMLNTAQANEPDAVLLEVIAGDWRSEANRARDGDRRPAEALTFWGLAPGMSILELQPGGGWWTEILAPYAARTGGQYHTTGADLDNPDLPERLRASRARFEERFSDRERYGKVTVLNFGATSEPLPESSFDFILSARAVHGWLRFDLLDKVMPEIAAALKPGGIFAIEQHRAPDDWDDVQQFIDTGYVSEAFVIAAAEAVGLELVGRAEVNANPRDTRDHPFGVWTLPPVRITVPYGSGAPANPDFDHAPFDAIGESDRMTLRFRRPE